MASASLSQEALVPMGPETSEDFGEKCGVFGVFEPGTNVALTTYEGLVMLKHRGQDASGQVVVTDDGELHLYKQLGNVIEVFDEGRELPKVLPVLGRLAIGHNRYGTMVKLAKEERWNAAQPIIPPSGRFAGAYNGDVENIHDVMARHEFSPSSYVSDTDAVMKLVDLYIGKGPAASLPNALRSVLPQLEGAFSGVFTDGKRLIGARDRNGFRPFVYGRTPSGGHVMASEVRARRQSGAFFEREIAAGEIMIIDENGMTSEQFAEPTPTPCAYEFFYFSKKDNVLDGQKVGDVRWRFGEELAREHPMAVDLVIGVPNSGITAAEAYAKTLDLPYYQAITERADNKKKRSFLGNNQEDREQIARNKFDIDETIVAGRKLLIVDDSVIRGTVSRITIDLLREAGATEVHVRVPSPAYKYACKYGMDTGRVEELLATGRSAEEMRDYIGADSLEFLSPDGVLRAAQRKAGRMCIACATGEYPTNVTIDLIK